MIPKRQEGYTLIELLIAVMITGLITGVLATSIHQFIIVSNHGTSRLVALDEVQNASRWLVRDSQSAYQAATPTACAVNCQSVRFSIPGGTPTYILNPGFAFGTITYTNAGTYPIEYYMSEGNLLRSIRDELPTTVASNVSATFTSLTIPGTRDRHYVSMNITAPLDHGEDIDKTFHIYLRTTGE